MSDYPRMATLKTAEHFRARLETLRLDLPFDEELQTAPGSPLARPIEVQGKRIGNRFVVQPMEGWDGEPNGMPSELTKRRWRNFGASGAKLVWGGEAVAVRFDGRANPNQLILTEATKGGIAELREELIRAHKECHGSTDDLLIGLQLTHSGRFCRPNSWDKLEPRIAYHHPILDRKFGIAPDDDAPVMTDAEVDDLIEDFVRAAVRAKEIGFDFVDIKHCHGYLLHEFLGARTRKGRYGGSFENRTRILREIVNGIRRDAKGLMIGVRLSAFDLVPFKPDASRAEDGSLGPGVPEDYADYLPYPYQFGVDPADPTRYNLDEPKRFLDLLLELDIPLVNLSAGSPYYNPHIQRPALFPPSDGYQPPEDPLVGAVRQIQVTRELKAHRPELVVVGTGYTYLQEWLPNVAQAVVREGWTDMVGLGRMMLSYPTLPADVLTGKPMQRRRICRTFSDCTTAPRNGMVSGCYPLDPFYKEREERAKLQELKA